MQKIFYNGKIVTFDEKLPSAEAFLMNDESIVFVGSNEEVLQMKTEETELINFEGKTVLPSFFDTNARVFELIENRLKTANKSEFIENLAEIDENYEKFNNYDIYKDEFLKIQNEYIDNGITTIFEMGVTNKEFIFWKKISESNDLKIDVIAFIDMITSKDVMDNNCRSYRKYKNHFRLGGYLIKIDGYLAEQKAHLTKKYKKERTYNGFSYVHDEQLSFLIKNALDEKKQIVAEVNGDESVNQFLRCFEENIKEKTVEEMFRPIAKNCNLITDNQIKKLKSFGISPSFEIDNIHYHGHKFIKFLGFFRSRNIQPIAKIEREKIPFLLNSSLIDVPNIFELIKIAVKRNCKNGKILLKKQQIEFKNALFSMIKHSSYLAFDDGFKGIIENGYRGDFVVLSQSIEEIEQSNNANIEMVFVDGIKIK